jgi:hypothetical protein
MADTTSQNTVVQDVAVISGVAAQLVPLVPIIALGVRLTVQLFKHLGGDIGPFQDEIAKFEAAVAGAQTAIDDYNARFRPNA